MSRKGISSPPSRYGLILASTGVVASLSSFFLEYLPHTVFIDKYKSILQFHKFGKPISLNKEIQQLANAVLKDLNIHEHIKKKIEFFPISGFEAYNAGIVSNYFKAIIGIPQHYTYKDITHVNTTKIRLGYDRNVLDIYHPDADKLLNSLILSEKAKKFSIAQEILMNQKNLPVYRSIENPIIISLTIGILEYGRAKLQISKKPLAVKLFYYIPICVSAFALWFQIRDNLKTYFEKNIDKSLAELGPDYVEGGKEFYQKQLERNIALRSLLGEQGIRAYNRDGNQLFFIRQKSTPITHRKKYFDNFIYETNEDAITTNVV